HNVRDRVTTPWATLLVACIRRSVEFLLTAVTSARSLFHLFLARPNTRRGVYYCDIDGPPPWRTMFLSVSSVIVKEYPYETLCSAPRVHAHRAARGHCHHCHPDRPVGPRRAKGAGRRRPRPVPEQPQANRPGRPQFPRCLEEVSPRDGFEPR